MILIVYIHINEEVFNMIPSELLQLQDEKIRVIDMDTRSGKEVVHAILTAMDLASSVILAFNITSGNQNCAPLFPVLKKAARRNGETAWVQFGDHAQLGIFHNRVNPVFSESEAQMISDILKELKT